MNFFDIILIGIALAMDACVVSIANCATYKQKIKRRESLSMPIAFALFQGIMPLIGFFVGKLFYSYIESISSFVTAGIFFLLSAKIVLDILTDDKNKDKCAECKPFGITLLLAQALATSIDALAVGLTFGSLTFSPYLAVLAISTVTFLLVSLAVVFGKFLSKAFGNYAEWAGALILFALSVKALVEGLVG